MVREVYYQSVENPIQADRLPEEQPGLQFLYTPTTKAQDARRVCRVLLALFGVSILSFVALRCFTHARPGSWIWKYFIWLLFPWLLVCIAYRLRDRRLAGVPVAACFASMIHAHVIRSTGMHAIAAALFIGSFLWLFGQHWIVCCTASPLRRRDALALQQAWNSYLSPLAMAPLAIVAIGFLAGAFYAWIIALALVAYQVVSALADVGPAALWRSLRRSMASWLTYNRRDVRIPGIVQSPAGDWATRVSLTGLCIYIVTFSIYFLPGPTVRSLADVARTKSWPELFKSVDGTDIWVLLLLGYLLFFSLPLILTFLSLLVLSPLLAEAERHARTKVDAGAWSDLVQEVASSEDKTERESVFTGRLVPDGSPLLVPRSVFREHAHFLGDSGSGKTALGLAPSIEQLGWRGDCSIIVVDLKADSMELYAALEETAKQARRRTGLPIPLKHFTNQTGRGTYGFNPLRQTGVGELDLYVRTDVQCGALGLTYGADYGEGYYSSANASVLYHTIKSFPETDNYRDMAEHVGQVLTNARRSELHPELRSAGVHVQAVLTRLGAFEALNVTPAAGYPQAVLDAAIDLTQVFHQPQMLYFHLSSTLAPGSSPEIARLVVYSLLAAATRTKRPVPVYLVIDEFQRMVARNVEYMLQLARSMGVGVILANQTMEDLRTGTTDLVPAIESNCRYRQWFAVSSKDDRERLSNDSGQTVDLSVTRTQTSQPNGSSTSVSHSEILVPRLSPNDIALASDHPKRSIVRISRGDGYAQYGGFPFIIESDYHITPQEYDRRKNLSWPPPGDGDFDPGQPNTPPRGGRPPGPTVTTGVVGGGPAPEATPVEILGAAPEQKQTSKRPDRGRSR